MKKLTFIIGALVLIFSCSQQKKEESKLIAHYLTNRQPLVSTPYLELPLGSIKPEG